MGERDDPPLFDLQAFALAIRLKLAKDDQSYREAAPAAGVSRSTLCRTARARGLPDVESYLRIKRWLESRPHDK